MCSWLTKALAAPLTSVIVGGLLGGAAGYFTAKLSADSILISSCTVRVDTQQSKLREGFYELNTAIGQASFSPNLANKNFDSKQLRETFGPIGVKAMALEAYATPDLSPLLKNTVKAVFNAVNINEEATQDQINQSYLMAIQSTNQVQQGLSKAIEKLNEDRAQCSN